MRSNIFERTQAVLRSVTSDRRRYKELEEKTGIPASNWQSAAKGKQKPTAVMVEALCRRWPKYAFWIATGLTDPENGHTAPAEAYTSRQGFSPPAIEEITERYFDAQTLLQDFFYGPSDTVAHHFESKTPQSADEEDAALQLRSKLAGREQPPILDSTTQRIMSRETVGQAIARLAFQQRLDELLRQFAEVALADHDPRELLRLIDEMKVKRAEEGLKLSKQSTAVLLRKPTAPSDEEAV
jgi:hypothetical protein